MSDAEVAKHTAIHSMTGHGLGEAPLGGGRVHVEVRAVNHRYLDARVRLPSELAGHSSAVEAKVREALRRGRVEVIGRFEGAASAGAVLDVDRARSAFEQLCALRDELRPGEDVPLSLLSCVPDLFGSSEALDPVEARAALLSAADAACEAVWTMRRREGASVAEDLRGHLSLLEAEVAHVASEVPTVVEQYRVKLRARLERLLADTDASLDPGRLEHEVALFADRADIAEELSRLGSHISQMRELLVTSEKTAGKRLDFLLQEMSREVNTIGSKSSSAELARRVVEMKAAVSRMREQAQNVL